MIMMCTWSFKENWQNYGGSTHLPQACHYKQQRHKALYGLLKSPLLFYKKLSSDLKEYRFTINPYDLCVANKIMNRSQMTRHVDDLKISHANSNKVTKSIKWLGTKYTNLTVHHGKIHDYLGIDLDFTTAGVLKVSMIYYTHKIMNEFPEEIFSPAATPAAAHLFRVQEPKTAMLIHEDQASSSGFSPHRSPTPLSVSKSKVQYSNCSGIPHH